ncbi:hypothetical protein BSU04_19800 [Caballeronia sordidicola]|uniref:Uncharacterized protein n=1 Tax=Caballeronia sordidicola TaxID=196367 RepID=A0A226X1H4_CABSO|nr:hypothetical protein BSU04_19800 [Caballeronia sordidicola]
MSSAIRSWLSEVLSTFIVANRVANRLHLQCVIEYSEQDHFK